MSKPLPRCSRHLRCLLLCSVVGSFQEDLDVVAFAYTPVPQTVTPCLSSFSKYPEYLIHPNQHSTKGRSRVTGTSMPVPSKDSVGEIFSKTAKQEVSYTSTTAVRRNNLDISRGPSPNLSNSLSRMPAGIRWVYLISLLQHQRAQSTHSLLVGFIRIPCACTRPQGARQGPDLDRTEVIGGVSTSISRQSDARKADDSLADHVPASSAGLRSEGPTLPTAHGEYEVDHPAIERPLPATLSS